MTSALIAVASILLPVVFTLAVIAGAFMAAALLLGLSELIADETRGWLEVAPRGILRLVATTQLPSDQREAIYHEEWLPELLCKMRKGEERPISRLVIGIWYAISLARGARKIGRELHGIREQERRAVPSAGSAEDAARQAHDDFHKARYGSILPTPGEIVPGNAPGAYTAAQGGVVIGGSVTLSGTGRISGSGEVSWGEDPHD